MPNPFLDIVHAVGAIRPGEGQTYTASNRDMNSPDDSSTSNLNTDDLHLLTRNADGSMPKVNFRPSKKKNDHSDDPRWTYLGDVPNVPETTDFHTALGLMLPHEGGYTAGKHDKGGATKWGISTKAWQAAGHTTPVSSITRPQMEEFYKSKYWDAVHADQFDPMLAQVMFDSGINNGTPTANKWLKQAQAQLPHADPKTRDGAQQLSRLILKYRQAKYDYLVGTGDPDYVRAKKAWNHRMDYMRKFVEQPSAKGQ